MLSPGGVFSAGSSPHTRGARRRSVNTARESGIIPAYAGSTVWRACASAWAEDHPRIRGEHRRPGRSGQRLSGSSPHTRGALVLDGDDPYRARIIPAYAGST